MEGVWEELDVLKGQVDVLKGQPRATGRENAGNPVKGSAVGLALVC